MITTFVGLLYMFLGIVGSVGNTVIFLLVVTVPTYHKSAYILMANIALADSLMAFIVGCLAGFAVLEGRELNLEPVICFLHITAWFAVILTYGALALNRCIGVCYANTCAALYNKPKVAAIVSTLIWLTAITIGLYGSMPSATLGLKSEIHTIVYYVDNNNNNSNKAQTVLWTNIGTNGGSIMIQWICSAIVVRKIWVTKKKAHRYQSHHRQERQNRKALRKQLRLFFQFFYPSIICTTSSITFLVISFSDKQMNIYYFIVAHIISIINHVCNPFIYFYFNPKLRQTAGVVFCGYGSGPACTHDSSYSTGGSPFRKLSRMFERRSPVPFRTRSVPMIQNDQMFIEAREEAIRRGSFQHPVLRRQPSPIMLEMRKWANLNKAIADVML